MTAYYNENDPKAAAWLRELIRNGHIADGIVDERSIEDIRPNELTGFTQCHFFAGIGGWSYALRLAGWPDERAVWTGSCPCQPFSAAGKGGGFADERHLWPAWLWLARQLRPGIIFGEQVANATQWIDLVQGDLEAEGYAIGYAVLGAHSVGAPHIRQRLYFVADSGSERQQQYAQRHGEPLTGTETPCGDNADGRSGSGELAESASEQSHGDRDAQGRRGELADDGIGGHSDDAGSQRRKQRGDGSDQRITRTSSLDGELGDATSVGRYGRSKQTGRAESCQHLTENPWTCEYVFCTDGKARPVEPGTFPLAHGIPGRVGLLRGYGNAIVPQVAAAFIQAYLECKS